MKNKIYPLILKKKIFEESKILNLREDFKKIDIFNKSISLLDLDHANNLIDFVFSKKLIKFIQSNLSEQFYFINDFCVQKNNRTTKKDNYHKDSGKKKQSDILSKKKNFYGKIGIPLQDNTINEGGGIDYLKPLIFDDFSDRNFLKNKIRAIYYILQDKFTDTRCYTKIGDVMYFSAMLSHRTTMTDINRTHLIQDKYVIYCQITNIDTITDVLQITRRKDKISKEEIDENVVIKKINNMEIKILDKNLSMEVSSYMGL